MTTANDYTAAPIYSRRRTVTSDNLLCLTVTRMPHWSRGETATLPVHFSFRLRAILEDQAVAPEVSYRRPVTQTEATYTAMIKTSTAENANRIFLSEHQGVHSP